MTNIGAYMGINKIQCIISKIIMTNNSFFQCYAVIST